MAPRTSLLIGTVCLLVTPAVAQFGVAGRHKKKGTTFEDMNEMAKEKFADGGGLGGFNAADFGDFGDLANMDLGEMGKMLENAMKDPANAAMLEDMTKGMESAMEQLKNIKPEDIANAMEQLNSGDVIDTLLEDKDELLKNMAATGMVSEEQLAEYQNNPDKLAADIKDAMGQMSDLLSNPETIESFQDLLSNPEKALESLMGGAGPALGGMGEDIMAALNDDDQIEAARQQLLNNPELAGSPQLAELYKSDEMKEILNDPIKWRDTVKKGQGMAFGEGDAAAAATGTDEL
mmetsp:Transcript_9424/g.13819  ORF Transcript_9424/g.13819 Transcript_9424/m.13819 type:complete len:291 (-) Transcript_9424:147-1019(-)|eukprot:CAMPEP_0195516732 /NCGR_PEP_ID=MMETSP0794_2-20130614/8341_1 /TAXON_ID=515487 /ORGANISM="Stephanopyxis turris, Strain CCMP 815" /LENGTH=290 /DNA_ID=CAMNT_0040645397 /DNA_START=107 /DNA_END=979 /DNA_ORIENTATION=+